MSGPPISADVQSPPEEQNLLLGAAIASALIGLALRRKNVFGTAAGIAGAGVLAALFAPRLARRDPAVATAAGALDVATEFTVRRAPAAVFDFFHNFENFPLVGGTVSSVEDFDDGRSRWRVRDRDASIEWDVIVTKYLPPRVIGWESTAGSPVESSGTLRFEALDDFATRVRVSLHYRPITDDAIRAFQGVMRSPERRVRAAIGRIERAMDRSLEPDVHHRAPRFPLPESPQTTATPPSVDPGPSPQP